MSRGSGMGGLSCPGRPKNVNLKKKAGGGGGSQPGVGGVSCCEPRPRI